MAVPTVEDLFSGIDKPADRARAMEEFKSELTKTTRSTAEGRASFDGPMAIFSQANPTAALEGILSNESISKALTADQLSSLTTSVEQAKAAMGELTKDLTLTSPLSTGFVPYDLEAPSKKVYPVLTPLRNRIPRVKGQGVSRKF
ncbi:MAG TPA: hypothetical protein VMT43_11600, partial [Acidimicrobiales bacterium]|nr:hypothetical protein [Acidimicrobiales bacterium]